MTKYLTAAETAALLRKALHESFPGAKFSVRISTYSGGASARVAWIDGPSLGQVEAIAKAFKGAEFDSNEDMKRSVKRVLDGQPVHFGIDFISVAREASDAVVQLAIDAVYGRFRGNFTSDGVAKPTVAQWRSGSLYRLQLTGLHVHGLQNVQADISAAVNTHSACGEPKPSATLARVTSMPAATGGSAARGAHALH